MIGFYNRAGKCLQRGPYIKQITFCL